MGDEGLLPVPNDLEFGQTIRGYVEGQQVFGRYTLHRIVGRGGMGLVWLARDEQLLEEVALKFLPELVRLDEISLEELKRETRRSRKLAHANIVKVYDFTGDTTSAAISMEFVDGTTLSGLRARQEHLCFEPNQIHDWLRQLFSAMSYAHEEALLVHRDMKPANVMVDTMGRVKVTDFGIASSINESVSRVTLQRGSSGTLAYMSPQQARGQPPAVSDDVYSLGATIFELLTGKPPFFSGEIYQQLLNETPVTMTQRRAQLGVEGPPIPSDWEHAIAACLAKEPADRPASVADLAEMLCIDLAAQTRRTKSAPVPSIVPAVPPMPLEPEPSAPEPPEKSKAVVLVLLALLLAAGVAVGWYIFIEKPAEDEKLHQAELIAQQAADKEKQLEAQQAADKEKQLEAQQAADAATKAKADADKAAADEAARLQAEAAKRAADDAAAAKAKAAEVVPSPSTTLPAHSDFTAGNGMQMRWVDPVGGWVGTYLVTQDEYQKAIGSNPSFFRGTRLPVESVSWKDAVAFCDKLTESDRVTDLLPKGHHYSLPTEAQYDQFVANADIDNAATGRATQLASTVNVGSYAPNSLGLYDTIGNVWEWCLDNYDDKGNHPLRGGCWLSSKDNLPDNSVRQGAPENDREKFIGFRVVLIPDTASTSAPSDFSTKARLPDDMRETAVAAAALFKQQKYEEAAAKYQVIIDKYPESLYAWSNLGVDRFQQGKFDEALKALQQAVKLSPTDAFSYSNLGIVYYQLNQFENAIDALNAAKALDPTDPKTHNYLGCVCSQKGWSEVAEKEFKKAIELDPNFGEAHFNLALVYATQKPPLLDLARREYNCALGLGIAKDPRLERITGVAVSPSVPITAAPKPTASEDSGANSIFKSSETLQQNYLDVYLLLNEAEKDEKQGDSSSALRKYLSCLASLLDIQRANPSWESALVTHRIADLRVSIARVR